MSFSVTSNLLRKQISATIDRPSRRAVPVVLRLVHPEGQTIQSVTIDGQDHREFTADRISLPPGPGRVNVVATYAEP